MPGIPQAPHSHSLITKLRRAAMVARPGSFWSRIMLLLACATLPLFLLLAAAVAIDGHHVIEAERERVLSLARLGAEQQDDILVEAANLLHAFALAPGILGGDVDACNDLLLSVMQDHPRLEALAVTDVDGTVSCATNARARGRNIADRSFFQEALHASSPKAFILSRLTISRITGKPTLFAAVPLMRRQNRGGSGTETVTIGVLGATLNLEWFARLPGRSGARGEVAEVLDSRDGAVVARSSGVAGSEAKRGDNEHAVITAFRANPDSGTLIAKAEDGTNRLYAYAPLPAGQSGLLIVVSVDLASMHDRVATRIGLALGAGLAVLALAILSSFLIARRALIRPLSHIVAASARIGAGDLSAPTSLRRGTARELRLLAIAFGGMVRRLRARDRRIAAMQQKLQASAEHHQLLANASNDIITRFSPDMHRLYISPACVEVLGFTPEEMLGTHYASIVHAQDWPAVQQVITAMMGGGESSARVTYRAMRKEGKAIWMEGSARRLSDGSGFVLVARDVSAQKTLEEQLETANRKLRVLAWHDGLTGVANRRRLDELLGQEYRRAHRGKTSLALIMLDVDHFKRFNDAYGHLGGDACLQRIAATLADLCRRPADLAARYGGEEFAVLLPNTDEAGAMAFAGSIQAAVRELAIPHSGSDTGMLTVSIGVAAILPSPDSQGPAALIESADAALYAAKNTGRNRTQSASLVNA